MINTDYVGVLSIKGILWDSLDSAIIGCPILKSDCVILWLGITKLQF